MPSPPRKPAGGTSPRSPRRAEDLAVGDHDAVAHAHLVRMRSGRHLDFERAASDASGSFTSMIDRAVRVAHVADVRDAASRPPPGRRPRNRTTTPAACACFALRCAWPARAPAGCPCTRLPGCLSTCSSVCSFTCDRLRSRLNRLVARQRMPLIAIASSRMFAAFTTFCHFAMSVLQMLAQLRRRARDHRAAFRARRSFTSGACSSATISRFSSAGDRPRRLRRREHRIPAAER